MKILIRMGIYIFVVRLSYSMVSKTIDGIVVDVLSRRLFKGGVVIRDGTISDVRCDTVLDLPAGGDVGGLLGPFIMPGFLDAHIHIESTMLSPVEYSRAVVGDGVVGSFSDPHEIANVCGVAGVSFMIENASKTPFPIWFGAPSCVPSVPFEKYGATISSKEIGMMLSEKSEGGSGLRYLGEMMNYPGVLFGDPEVTAKIEAARSRNKPVDGHAPGLSGSDLKRYIEAGISTDHECSTFEEAREKASLGMNIMIREGSAAKNYESLKELIGLCPEKCMFCTDDCHPGDLSNGTIRDLVRRSVRDGYDLFDVLTIACINPAVHFGLTRDEHGLLQKGDSADLIVVSDLRSFDVLQTYIGGRCVFDRSLEKEGKSAVLIPSVTTEPINVFNTLPRTLSDFCVAADRPDGTISVKVIETVPEQLLTKKTSGMLPVRNGEILADPAHDILKIVAVDRYHPPAPGKSGLSAAFVKGFGIKAGAVASSVSHDCHNIIAVGSDDKYILEAIDLIIENKGGLCAVAPSGRRELLPLPIAGLMSLRTKEEVAAAESALCGLAREIGLVDGGFMMLSFMALPVIPELRLCPDGLFDVSAFSFIGLEE